MVEVIAEVKFILPERRNKESGGGKAETRQCAPPPRNHLSGPPKNFLGW